MVGCDKGKASKSSIAPLEDVLLCYVCFWCYGTSKQLQILFPIPYFTWWNIFHGSWKWQQDPKRCVCVMLKRTKNCVLESKIVKSWSEFSPLFFFSFLFFWNLSLLLKDELTLKLPLLHDFVFISCLTGWTIFVTCECGLIHGQQYLHFHLFIIFNFIQEKRVTHFFWHAQNGFRIYLFQAPFFALQLYPFFSPLFEVGQVFVLSLHYYKSKINYYLVLRIFHLFFLILFLELRWHWFSHVFFYILNCRRLMRTLGNALYPRCCCSPIRVAGISISIKAKHQFFRNTSLAVLMRIEFQSILNWVTV